MKLTNVASRQQANAVLKVDVDNCQFIVPYHSLGEEFDVQFKQYVLSQLGVENE